MALQQAVHSRVGGVDAAIADQPPHSRQDVAVVDSDTRPGNSPLPRFLATVDQTLRVGKLTLTPDQVDAVYAAIEADTIRELRGRGKQEPFLIDRSHGTKIRLVRAVVKALGDVRPGATVVYYTAGVNRVMAQVHEQACAAFPLHGLDAGFIRRQHVFCSDDEQRRTLDAVISAVGCVPQNGGR